MCKILEISRSLIYYKNNKDLENNIKQIFKESRINYGSRKIKVEFQKNTYNVSIRMEFTFNGFEELEIELFNYINCYNNLRIHSSLNYLTTSEYKKVLTIQLSNSNSFINSSYFFRIVPKYNFSSFLSLCVS